MQKEWLSDEERRVYEDPRSEFRGKLDALMRPGDVKEEEVGLGVGRGRGGGGRGRAESRGGD